jgi:hypothetical protein
MEIKIIDECDVFEVIGMSKTANGIDFDVESLAFNKYLIESLRNIYGIQPDGIECRTAKTKLLRHLQNVIHIDSQKIEIANQISKANDLLRDIGEIVRIDNGNYFETCRSQISMYVELPGSTGDDFSKVLLLGPCWKFSRLGIPAELTFDESMGLRYLSGETIRLKNFLGSIDLYPLPFEQWRGYPKAFSDKRIIEILGDKLSAVKNHSSTRDLLVFERGHQEFYLGRKRSLKRSDDGIFVAVLPGEYGSEVSFVVKINAGEVQSMVSLPIEEICDSEKDCHRLLIAALDSTYGSPSLIREEKVYVANEIQHVALSFYMPPVSWLQKTLLAWGTLSRNKSRGSLFTYAISESSRDSIVQTALSDMFLEIEK